MVGYRAERELGASLPIRPQKCRACTSKFSSCPLQRRFSRSPQVPQTLLGLSLPHSLRFTDFSSDPFASLSRVANGLLGSSESPVILTSPEVSPWILLPIRVPVASEVLPEVQGDQEVVLLGQSPVPRNAN